MENVSTLEPGQSYHTDHPSQVNQPHSHELTAPFKCFYSGRFPYPHSCEKYNFCWDNNENDAVFSCPHHQAFDPKTQHCVHNFAVCASAPKCEHNKRILPNVNDKSTYFVCKFRHLSKDFVLRMFDCADGREFDANLGYCRSKFLDDDFSPDSNDSSEEMECQKPGIFADYSNDSNYIECMVKSVSKGTIKLIRRSCPKYHIFTLTEKRCVPYFKW